MHTVIMLAALTGPVPVAAEVVASSDTHFVLQHKATSSLSADALWAKLIAPQTWWHPDHTYSGDSANLSLDPVAGGLWLESWSGGSVAHGTVLMIEHGKQLQMNAPFGPLLGVGAYTIWTIRVEAQDSGSVVVFDEVSTAPAGTAMNELALAVDFVKNEAITRLVAD